MTESGLLSTGPGDIFHSSRTFITPFSAARANARGASGGGTLSAILSHTFVFPRPKTRTAAYNFPQREPTRVISLTTMGAVSSVRQPCIVDFITTVPRG